MHAKPGAGNFTQEHIATTSYSSTQLRLEEADRHTDRQTGRQTDSQAISQPASCAQAIRHRQLHRPTQAYHVPVMTNGMGLDMVS